MIAQKLVAPEDIEKTLTTIWESLGKKNTRACLFNLIVYTKCNVRSDHFRQVINNVVENYPCRILFLSKDLDCSRSYLKTAVRVIAMENGSNAACDSIDIGYTSKYENRIFSLILPHLVPDLPTHLLCLEPPCCNNPLFLQLDSLCNRVILDAGSCMRYATFLEKLRCYLPKRRANISDLHWTRTLFWRSLFEPQLALQEEYLQLSKAHTISIHYNSKKNSYIPHPILETLYFVFWLASRCKWKAKKKEANKITFSNTTVLLKKKDCDNLRPGAIFSIEIIGKDYRFFLERQKAFPQEICVQTTRKNSCDFPYTVRIPRQTKGASVCAEMVKKQTNAQYLETIKLLLELW